jgi:hypothetical protein
MPENNILLPQLEEAYRKSLRAMNTELAALLEFAYNFKGEESSQRLMQAQELIIEELKEATK